MQPRGRCRPGIDVLLLILFVIFATALVATAQSGTHAPGASMLPQPNRHARDITLAATMPPTGAHRPGQMAPTSPFLATIFHASGERQGLAAGDLVVINAGTDHDLQTGDRFTVLRKSPPHGHAVTAHVEDTSATPLGYATAMRVQPSATILQLTKTFDTVEVGDQVKKVAAPQSQDMPAAVSPPARDIRGFILATRDGIVSVGEGDIVYIDRGQTQGVRIGDRFSVFRDGETVRHPITRRLVRLPRRVLGELTVLEVSDRTATALVAASRREMTAGAPVELYTAQDSAQARPLMNQDLRPMEAEAMPADDASPERVAHAELAAQVDARLAQLVPCLEAALQAIRAAEAAGAPNPELALARSALGRAVQRLEQAKAFLAQNDVERARSHLDAARADCLTAHELSQQAGIMAASRTPAAAERYTVQRGDSLWGISAQDVIYRNPLMWPMIYQGNRQQIQDPDLIFPTQIIAIPRGYSQEEAEAALQRARRRGPWKLGDGPDMYILEGGP